MNPMVTSGEYPVGSGPITLEVVIGEGQRGRCAVLVNGAEVKRGSDRVRVNLGNGAQLRGGQVSVVGTINHTNPSTTRCSVTYTFSGGAAPRKFSGDADFATDGEPVDFDGNFTLF